MLHDVGLGRNFADYTQLSLLASVLPLPMLTVTPELTILRQGRHHVVVRFLTDVQTVSVTAPLAEAAVDLSRRQQRISPQNANN